MPKAESGAPEHESLTHQWWECEECHKRVSDILDGRVRKNLIAHGVSEHDADLLIAQARETGQRIREARVTPPAATQPEDRP